MKELETITKVRQWSDLFPDLMKKGAQDHTIKFSVEHFSGTNRQVADRARTTIGLDPGTQEVKPEYMRRLYLCEHSPIRVQHYLVKVENIPYSTAMHFVRHHNGVEPFISTGRDDRVEIDNMPSRDRDLLPVTMELDCNSQAFLNISRKRLCSCSHIRTILVWKIIKELVTALNESLGNSMVKDCIYRGWCYEHKTCGYHLSDDFKEDLEVYRNNINLPKREPVKFMDIIQVNLKEPYFVEVAESQGYHTDDITATLIHSYKDFLMLDYNQKVIAVPLSNVISMKKVGTANVGENSR